ncbi:hypothetical protein BofuT4_P085390.1 [Botrytis cinerea T4]|uniref:Uncharacterized protein n=1 Tax=Botryotinia fuckeliana (strain T4) TaxID=999810 RepID=G2YHJ0_BOTF4|nr:hypothetical protein BofuT4_P085390.1 [Botrytis cinerea T4]
MAIAGHNGRIMTQKAGTTHYIRNKCRLISTLLYSNKSRSQHELASTKDQVYQLYYYIIRQSLPPLIHPRYWGSAITNTCVTLLTSLGGSCTAFFRFRLYFAISMFSSPTSGVLLLHFRPRFSLPLAVWVDSFTAHFAYTFLRSL